MSSPGRQYRPLTPMSSPVAVRTHHHTIQQPFQPGNPLFRSHGDKWMLQFNPNHQCMTDQELKELLYDMGATDDTLWEYLAKHNKEWDEFVAEAPNGKFVTLGEQPQINHQDVQLFPIPSSNLAIRIWPGGMEQYGQYCLDFFDVHNHIAVNTPDQYEISHVHHPGVYTLGTKLVTWEKAMGAQNVDPGTEKYSAPEGSRLVLTRPREEPYFFKLPARPVPGVNFAEPQRWVG